MLHNLGQYKVNLNDVSKAFLKCLWVLCPIVNNVQDQGQY